MPATVSIFYDKGGSDDNPGSELDRGAGGIRFRTDDDADTIDDTNPIPIPSAGVKLSYYVHLYMKVTGGSFTQIDNVKFYTGGGNLYGDAGVDLFVGDETPINNITGPSQGGYDLAATGSTEGDSGAEMVVNHAHLTNPRLDASAITSGAPKDISISETGNIIDAAPALQKTDYIVAQIEVDNTATAGTKSAETLTWRFDET